MPLSDYDKQRMIELIDAQSLGKPTTLDELAEDMHKLIRFRGLHYHAAVRLVELNRRYGSTASKLGGNIRQILAKLILADKVGAEQVAGNTVVYDHAALESDIGVFRMIIKGELPGKANDAAMGIEKTRQEFFRKAFDKSVKEFVDDK